MRRIALLSVLMLALTAFLPGLAHAQATRTWVSGVGDDANPCSRTAPCKTFAGAISKTAPAGEIDCLDPGGFGAVTITKSITIDCHAGLGGGVLVAGTNGIVINAGTGNVVLRDVNFQGLGSQGTSSPAGLAAINVLGAGSVLIEGVNITGFGGSSTAAINVVPTCSPAATVKVDIRDTTVNNNLNGAILLKPGAGCSITASLTRVNMFTSTFGLQVQDRAVATVFQSVASNDTGIDYNAVSAGGNAFIYLTHSVATNSGTAVESDGNANAKILMDNMQLVGNGTGISQTGGGQVNGTSPGTNLNINTVLGTPCCTDTLQ